MVAHWDDAPFISPLHAMTHFGWILGSVFAQVMILPDILWTSRSWHKHTQALSRELYNGNHHVMIRRELCTKWKPHHEKWLYFRDIYSSHVTAQGELAQGCWTTQLTWKGPFGSIRASDLLHKTFAELLQAQFPPTAKPNRLLSNPYGEQHGFRSNGVTFLASMVSLAKLRRGTTA